MANYNIGPKIGIEGEKEFRAQISRINREYSAMESYTTAVSTAMQQQGKSQELLASKANGLRQQLGLQEQKFRELSNALEKAKASYGENSQEVLRFEGAILDVKTTTAALQRELDATDDELRRMADGIEDVGDAAEDADDKVLSFGDMLKAGVASGAILNGLERAGELIVEVGAQSIEAAAEVKAANAQFSQTFGDLEGTATSALRSISAETGIAVTRLQGGYTALYAFTKSVGGDQNTALNIAKRAMKAAADSAAYYDRTMEDATETLQSFLKGNYENDAALGIAATETTRNAKANELYAKSFKELSESQKVDVLLSMVEAGNKASGALGQAAREADSWANVTGELAESWRQFLASLGGPIMEGLIPIMQGINEQLNAWATPRPIHELNDGIDAFREGIQGASDALATSNADIAAQAELAQRYVDRLRALEGAGLDTAESQREYAQTVELLNSVMPDLNLSINQNTGRLEQNTWAIEDNIRSLRAQAEQQAKIAYYQDIMSEYGDVIKERNAAERELVRLQTEEIGLAERLAEAEAEWEAAGRVKSGDAYNRYLMADADYRININHQEELKESLSELNAELEENGALLDEAAANTSELTDATGGAAAATDGLSTAVSESAKAYQDLKAEAKKSIDSQIGLFDELADESKWSAEKIIENWGKQQEAFANYEDNLKKAVDMGLDEALVAQLSDGSERSMMILDEFLNGTSLTIDEINAAFGGLSEAKDSLSGTMAEMEAIANGTYADMEEAAREAGYNTMDGLIDAIYDRTPRLERAMENAARKAPAAFNRTIEIHSPSRVMARSGRYTIAGVVQGVELETPKLERAMSEAARSANSAYLQEQLDYVAQYPAMVAGAPGYGGGTTANTRNVAYGGISININTQPGQDAQSIADAVIQELTVRLGQEEAAF